MEKIRKKNIDQLKILIASVDSISESDYSRELELLSNSTVGKHIRHIIDFYLILMNSMASGKINYDNRVRQESLETKIDSAKSTIQIIIDWLENKFESYSIEVFQEGSSIGLKSSTERELQYVYEHTTHHMAIVKIGFKILQPEWNIPESFGVADSTLSYRTAQ
jgi:uncharacterized damage-inducible protein DinB